MLRFKLLELFKQVFLLVLLRQDLSVLLQLILSQVVVVLFLGFKSPGFFLKLSFQFGQLSLNDIQLLLFLVHLGNQTFLIFN